MESEAYRAIVFVPRAASRDVSCIYENGGTNRHVSMLLSCM